MNDDNRNTPPFLGYFTFFVAGLFACSMAIGGVKLLDAVSGEKGIGWSDLGVWIERFGPVIGIAIAIWTARHDRKLALELQRTEFVRKEADTKLEDDGYAFTMREYFVNIAADAEAAFIRLEGYRSLDMNNERHRHLAQERATEWLDFAKITHAPGMFADGPHKFRASPQLRLALASLEAVLSSYSSDLGACINDAGKQGHLVGSGWMKSATEMLLTHARIARSVATTGVRIINSQLQEYRPLHKVTMDPSSFGITIEDPWAAHPPPLNNWPDLTNERSAGLEA
jgi:hypothetical protein